MLSYVDLSDFGLEAETRYQSVDRYTGYVQTGYVHEYVSDWGKFSTLSPKPSTHGELRAYLPSRS
jgi:hypothetical protein